MPRFDSKLLELGDNAGARGSDFGSYDAQWVHPRVAVGAWPRPEDVHRITAAGVRGVLNLVNYCFREQMLYVAAP